MPRRKCGFRADRGHSYRSIEQYARLVREVVGSPPSERLPGIELFENLDDITLAVGDRCIGLDYGSKDLPPGTEAETRYDSENDKLVVFLSEETYADLLRDGVRARFTLGHEIGHALMHPDELVRLSRIEEVSPGLARAPHPIYLDTEWQADAFAGALLVPAQGLAKLQAEGNQDARSLPPSVIAAVFGVSHEAASIRRKIFMKRRGELL